jgi:hypothetical protein
MRVAAVALDQQAGDALLQMLPLEAERKLAIPLYWMPRANTAYPEVRSYREQLTGGPARRKVDRRIDWALSSGVLSVR